MESFGWDTDLFLRIYTVCTSEQGDGLNRAVKITTQSNKAINETAKGEHNNKIPTNTNKLKII